jgi:SAM-dependent methyltransferase
LADDDPLSELWLIDDCAVVRKVLSDHAPPVWVVSVREQDVKRAQSLWDLLASRVDAVRSPGVPNLVEPLLESAKMIHTMAPMSCTSSHVDRISCSWYHGVWQYLRLLDMVSSPTWHSEFYQHWLTDSLCDRATKRVLITGTADYSVLAYVIAAATSIGRLNNIETHVLDLCPTPLAECRWYAERARTSVRLHEADILDEADGLVARVAGDERFDLIVTDAFLTRFSRDEVGRVLDNWHALLRPGGRVITTVRLHPLEAHQPSGRPQDLLLYALRLRERAIGFRGMLSIDLDALVKAASEYIERMTSTDLGDVREIATLLQQHGFDPGDPDKIETEKVHGEIVRSTYGRLVLTRT